MGATTSRPRFASGGPSITTGRPNIIFFRGDEVKRPSFLLSVHKYKLATFQRSW